MSTRLKAELERKIEQWIVSQCEKPDFQGLDVWCHEDMVSDMATAAYAVFMACAKSQAERKQ